MADSARKSVAVELRLRSQQYQQGLARAGGQMRTFGRETAVVAGQMKRDFTDAALSIESMVMVAAGLKIGSDMIDAASRLEQAVGGTAAVFGDASGAIDEFSASAAETAGLSERAARELTTRLGASLTQVGVDAEEAAESAIDLTQAGADLAATFGGETEEAVNALAAAFRGEFDPLERFGITLRATEVSAKAVSMGLADSASEVDNYGRTMATLALVSERSAEFQGQFAREAGTAAGAQAIARAEMENTRAELGQNLLPLYTKAMETLSALANVFGSLPGPIQSVVVALGALVAFQGPIRGTAAAVKTLWQAMSQSTTIQFAMTQVQQFAGSIERLNGMTIAPKIAGSVGVLVTALEMINELSDQGVTENTESFAEAMVNVGDAAEGAAQYMESAFASTGDLAEAMTAAEATWTDFADAALGSDDDWAAFVAQVEQAAEALGLDFGPILNGMEAARGQIVEAGDEFERTAALTGDVGEQAERSGRGMLRFSVDTREAADGAEEASRGVEALSDALDMVDSRDRFLATIEAIQQVRDEAAETNEGLTEAVQDASRATAEARQDLADTITDANQRIAEAEADAARAVEDAQRAVVDAHEQAADSIADAQEKVTDAVEARADAEEDAAERVEDAQKKLRRTEEDATREIADARQELNDAIANNEDYNTILRLRNRLEDLEREHARKLEDARDAVADAERDKADKLEDADEDIQDAREALTEAMQEAAERIASAEQAQADAVSQAGEQIEAAEADKADAVSQAQQRVSDALTAEAEASANLTANWVSDGQIMREVEKKKRDALAAMVEFLTGQYGPAWDDSTAAMKQFLKVANALGIVDPGVLSAVSGVANPASGPSFSSVANAVTTGLAKAPAGKMLPVGESAASGRTTILNQNNYMLENPDIALERLNRRAALALEGVA